MAVCHFRGRAATHHSFFTPRKGVWNRVGDVVGGRVWNICGVW